MTTEQMIEEALMRLRAKVKKLVKDNVRYLVSDPDDIRVGILSQEQMEYWVVSLCKKELQTIATKSAKEITFDATGAYWEGEEHGWLLVAIKNGSVIWGEKTLQPEIRSIFHKVTGRYSSEVTTEEETKVAAEYLYQLSLNRKDANE